MSRRAVFFWLCIVCNVIAWDWVSNENKRMIAWPLFETTRQIESVWGFRKVDVYVGINPGIRIKGRNEQSIRALSFWASVCVGFGVPLLLTAVVMRTSKRPPPDVPPPPRNGAPR